MQNYIIKNITTVSLCNLYSYMFRHISVIIREVLRVLTNYTPAKHKVNIKNGIVYAATNTYWLKEIVTSKIFYFILL